MCHALLLLHNSLTYLAVKEQTASVEQALRCIELCDQHHISQPLHDSILPTGHRHNAAAAAAAAELRRQYVACNIFIGSKLHHRFK